MSDPKFEEIRPRTKRLGHTLIHLARVDSTMRVARERAQAGEAEGLVVVAEEQTAGLGRLGRTWHSPPGSLLFTLLLRPQVRGADLRLLPLATATALAAAIEVVLQFPLRLKWPNDLVHAGRKLGGVLVEAVYEEDPTIPEYVLVGVGLNGNLRLEAFPEDLRATATSLSLLVRHPVCLPAVLKRFLEEFERRYDRVRLGKTTLLWQETRDRMATLGQAVRIRRGADTLEGLARELGPNGELLVDTNQGVVAVDSGECEELRPLETKTNPF